MLSPPIYKDQDYIRIAWNKPALLFQQYLDEAKVAHQFVWVTFVNNQFAVYVTLKRHSFQIPNISRSFFSATTRLASSIFKTF